MNIPKPLITKEHGSWPVLFVPMIVSTCVTQRFTIDVLFVALSVACVVLSYPSLQIILRHWFVQSQGDEKLRPAIFWASVFLFMACVLSLPLLAKGFWLLLPIGGIGALFSILNVAVTSTFRKTAGSDLLAVLGLTLGSPAVYYVAMGRIDMTAVSVWFLNFLFFGCGIFYVHMKMRATGLKRSDLTMFEKLSIGKLNIAYHLVVLIVVFLLTWMHYTPQLVFAAFVPMAIHAFTGTVTLTRRIRFRSLGFVLLGQSIVFSLLMILAKWS